MDACWKSSEPEIGDLGISWLCRWSAVWLGLLPHVSRDTHRALELGGNLAMYRSSLPLGLLRKHWQVGLTWCLCCAGTQDALQTRVGKWACWCVCLPCTWARTRHPIKLPTRKHSAMCRRGALAMEVVRTPDCRRNVESVSWRETCVLAWLHHLPCFKAEPLWASASWSEKREDLIFSLTHRSGVRFKWDALVCKRETAQMWAFSRVKTSERGTLCCLSTALSPPGLTFASFVKPPALGGGRGVGVGEGQWALMDTEFQVYSHQLVGFSGDRMRRLPDWWCQCFHATPMRILQGSGTSFK